MKFKNSVILGLKFHNIRSCYGEVGGSFHTLSKDMQLGNFTSFDMSDGITDRVLYNSRGFGRGNGIGAFKPFVFDVESYDSPKIGRYSYSLQVF